MIIIVGRKYLWKKIAKTRRGRSVTAEAAEAAAAAAAAGNQNTE